MIKLVNVSYCIGFDVNDVMIAAVEPDNYVNHCPNRMMFAVEVLCQYVALWQETDFVDVA